MGREYMKISRCKMIWGLKRKIFEVLWLYLMIVVSTLFAYREHYSINSIIFAGVGVGTFFFFYVVDAFGYVIDIIIKNIGETGWIPEKNIKFINYSAVLYYNDGRIDGCSKIKVFEEGRRTKKLKVYIDFTPWPEGVISQYKIYYLKICKAVVGWEVIKGEKEKINLIKKTKKSK